MDDEDQQNVLELRKDNVKELSKIIKSMLFRENGTVYALSTGVRLIVEDGSCQQQVNAYMNASTFSSYVTREDDIKFRVPFKTLAECMSVSEGSTASVKITYAGFGEPLKVTLEEGSYTVHAKIHTLTPETILEFDFDDSDIVARCVLKSTIMKDIFKDFDSSSRTLLLEVSSKEVNFVTNGEIGKVTATIPSRSLQMDSLTCANRVSFRYRMVLIQRMTSALGLASKVALRVDNRGVLSAQFMIDLTENQKSYIEFYTAPDDENYDD